MARPLSRAVIGPRLRAVGVGGLLVFALVALATPNWRAGPLTWWPSFQIELPTRGAVRLGAVYGLPLVAAGLWMLGIGLTRNGVSQVFLKLKQAWPMTLLVSLLIAWLLARVRWDLSQGEALMASGALLMWGLVYVMLVGEALDPQWMAMVLVAAASVHALVGLGQFALQSDVGWQILGEEKLNPRYGGVTVIEIDSQRILRAYGLARHPNTVGGLLAVGALAAANGVGLARSSRQRWLYLVALSLITAGLLVTFSRSAWLGAASGGAVWVWAARSRWRWSLMLTMVVVSVMVGVFVLARPELFMARLLGGLSNGFRLEQDSFTARALALPTAWGLIQHAPWLGVGVRGYAAAGAALTGGSVELVHNVPLLLWAEAGVGAAGLWLGLWGLMLWAVRRGPPTSPGLVVALAWMTCLQVANQFNYYLAPAQNLQAPVLLGLVCGAWAVSFVCSASSNGPAARASSAG